MTETNEKNLRNSRRKFIKAGAIAGGAAVVGLSMGLPALTKAATTTSATTPTTLLTEECTTPGYPYPNRVNRKYYLYATDGIAWLPTSPTGDTRRPIYTYGFAKPLSDTRPLGSTVTPTNPFADLNWIDPTTGNPIMRGKAQLPAPPIWGIEGDTIEVTLFNLGFLYRPDIMDAHTCHLHGVHAPTYYDGIPEISFGIPMYTGGPTSDPNTIANYSFTYKMYCERPGTYMYHCHVEASEHVQMGMYGSMWIYPKQFGAVKTGGAAYNNSLTRFNQEAIILLSEFDTRWHDQLLDLRGITNEAAIIPGVVGPATDSLVDFNPVDYRPNFWLVNGRAFPDTVFPGKYTAGYQPGTATTADISLTYYPGVTIGPNTYYIPRQPVQTYLRTAVAEKVLVRLTNMGFQYQPEHFHGVMPAIVGKDTFAWVPQPNSMFSTTTDQRRRVFTQGIFSGESYDMIIAYPDKAAISPSLYGTILNTTINDPYSPWEPTWGTVLPAVAGTPTVPTALVPSSDGSGNLETGFKSGYPLFYLWHSHDDYRVTNDGSYPGGAVILVRVDKTGTGPQPAIPANLIP